MVNHPNRRKRLKSADLEAVAVANKVPVKTAAAIAEALGFEVEKFYVWIKEEDGARFQVGAVGCTTRGEADLVAAKLARTQPTEGRYFVTTKGKPLEAMPKDA
jgi:hypothetical protein